ncbi:unnamed protein product [Thelazia callipaeda]|uniref:AAA domain-containing protein n=1 Tax=Thelazia callipaeda TaxID=103827 RepID=A0A0N5D5J6_THECL|nr:unnamed protein product [Thelazia callipaeda]
MHAGVMRRAVSCIVMSSKKRNAVVGCANCSSYVQAKDLDMHQKMCVENSEYGSEFLLHSNVNLLVPNIGILTTSQGLTGISKFLPPDLIGWEKSNFVLMHPNTMNKLPVLPRQPCLLCSIDDNSNSYAMKNICCVTVWPCEQVKELYIFAHTSKADSKYLISLVNSESIRRTSIIQLRPSAGHFSPVYARKHFRDYLTVYLSNAYLLATSPICVHYYGQEHFFDIVMSTEKKMEMLDISNFSRPVLLKPKSDCIYHIIDTTVPVMTSAPLSFDCFGGAESVKMEIEEALIEPLRKGKEACSVILSGYTGCGKTLMLLIIQECLQDKAIQLSNEEEFENFLENGASNSHKQMAVLIDRFENFTQFSEKLCNFMDTNSNFVFVLTVRNIEAVDLPLRGRFPCEMELLVPSLPERMEILHLFFKSRQIKLSLATNIIRNIAEKTHGYTGGDLKALFHRVWANFHSNDIGDILQRFDFALKRMRPAGIRQFVLQVPDVRWEDIGGNEALKRKIEQAVLWPYQYPEIFERFGSKPPSGILLYGPPGCSKTLIARAVASVSHMNFLAVKGPELFSKWVGESERAIRELFRRARQVAPSVIFFDEIDAVGANRGERNESHVGERVLTQLLTELDGLEDKGYVLVLAATNRPDRLDNALLRPGRFNLTIHVPLPDLETRQLEILRIRLSKVKVESNFDMMDIGKKTEGFSGAELIELCEQAVREALMEDRAAHELHSRHFD